MICAAVIQAAVRVVRADEMANVMYSRSRGVKFCLMDRIEMALTVCSRLVPRVITAAPLAIACAAVLTNAACAKLDDTSTICSEDVDCRLRIPIVPGPDGGDDGPDPTTTPWGCLTVPRVPPAAPPAVVFAMAVVDFNNPTDQAAIPELNVAVCQAMDFTCENPLNRPGSPVQVQMDIPDRPAPLFAVGLPTAIPLYLRMTAPGFLQTEYYFLNELVLNLEGPGTAEMPPTVLGDTTTLPRDSKFDEFFQQVAGSSTARDPMAGIVALRTFDCQGNRAAGVTLDILSATDGNEFSWVFSTGYPVRGTVTNRDGVAGFANLKPTLGATIEIDGIAPDGTTRFGRVTLNVRPSGLSFAEVRPIGAYKR